MFLFPQRNSGRQCIAQDSGYQLLTCVKGLFGERIPGSCHITKDSLFTQRTGVLHASKKKKIYHNERILEDLLLDGIISDNTACLSSFNILVIFSIVSVLFARFFIINEFEMEENARQSYDCKPISSE